MQACPPSYFTPTRRHLGKDLVILMELQSPLNSNGDACRSVGTIVLAFPQDVWKLIPHYCIVIA